MNAELDLHDIQIQMDVLNIKYFIMLGQERHETAKANMRQQFSQDSSQNTAYYVYLILSYAHLLCNNYELHYTVITGTAQR